MPDELRKRPLTRRRAITASAPAEGGAPVAESVGSRCGHDGCSESPRCNVRYVGPMSSVQAHHALHAARGAAHIWTASIITGFAVVLTGVVAFQSAQAKGVPAADARSQVSAAQIAQLNQRLERIERAIRETKMACEEDGEESVDADGSAAREPVMSDEEQRALLKKKMLLNESQRPLLPRSGQDSTGTEGVR